MPQDKKDVKEIQDFISIDGVWEKENHIIKYLGPTFHKDFKGQHGLILFPHTLSSGSIKAKIKFLKKSYARIVIGFDARTKEYYSIGLGGYDFAYVIDKFEDGKGWRALIASGLNQHFDEDKEYYLEVKIEGQRVKLIVNHVIIFDFYLPEPLKGKQTGLFAWGQGQIEFANVTIEGEESLAKAFVIMEFSEPFKSLYEEVIVNVCHEAGLYVYKADEIYAPGIILNDIIYGIMESEVIIADITPVNANVFYELGYAHAYQKPTILLAQKETQLPFDLSGYRVIFYTDSIKGKRLVEEQLRKHLRNILQ